MNNLNSDERAEIAEVRIDPSGLVSAFLGFSLPVDCAPGVLVAMQDLLHHVGQLRGAVYCAAPDQEA